MRTASRSASLVEGDAACSEGPAAAPASAGLDVEMVREGVDLDLDVESLLALPTALIAHQRVSGGAPPPGQFSGLHVRDSAPPSCCPRVSSGSTGKVFGPERYHLSRSTPAAELVHGVGAHVRLATSALAHGNHGDGADLRVTCSL